MSCNSLIPLQLKHCASADLSAIEDPLFEIEQRPRERVKMADANVDLAR